MPGRESVGETSFLAVPPPTHVVYVPFVLLIGFIAGFACLWGVNGLKRMLGADDSLDVFGVHCVGGIIGALATAIVADPALGGQGFFDYTVFPAGVGAYDMGAQMLTQVKAVLITLVWSGGVSALLFYALKFTIGLRPSDDAEREGLDLSEHGERAYNH